jgi:hypothetical protein
MIEWLIDSPHLVAAHLAAVEPEVRPRSGAKTYSESFAI